MASYNETERQRGLEGRVVGTWTGGLVIAHDLPSDLPDHLEHALTDLFFRPGVVSWEVEWWLEDWLDEPAIQMLIAAIDSGFIWSRKAPSPVHVFVGATLIAPALADLGPEGWSVVGEPDAWIADAEMPGQDITSSPSRSILVASAARADAVFEVRSNQCLDFADRIAAGDWSICPDCGEPWDEDDCECIAGCFRPEFFHDDPDLLAEIWGSE